MDRASGKKLGKTPGPLKNWWKVLGALSLLAAVALGLLVFARAQRDLDLRTDLFLYDGGADAWGGMPPHAEEAIGALLREADPHVSCAPVKIDYPLEGSVFPPEICPPTFLWHDGDNQSSAWLVDVHLPARDRHIYVLTAGRRTLREIDPRCVTDINVYQEPLYEAAARAWTPAGHVWDIMKRWSVSKPAVVTVFGLHGTPDAPGGRRIVSRGSVSITTSNDPVGAQIFYRDVPLMPSKTEDGVIRPLKEGALPLIQWRLRDISKPAAPVVMEHLPTCANCHSFSRDGRTVGMDMDGPGGDKGAHFVKSVSRHMVVDTKDVFSWNSYTRQATGEQSYGLFPRLSPDGRYVLATIHESLHVSNYMQFEFLQTFYPTRGILAVYYRETGEIKPLPGADDPGYVQSNGEWSPDGRTIVFIRAKARDPYGPGTRPRYANDPNETQIQYDLYRIPFNGGRGGTPEPVAGASNNGASNSFPRFSPDGKWIVFVQCHNAMLMRPDGRLFIVGAAGGRAREMKCNTPRMNSYHSFSPDGRWLVFSSKWPTPYTQMYLTYLDEDGNDTPAVLVPNSTLANRAVNLPEFADIAPGGLVDITTPAVDYRRHLDRARKLQEKGEYAEAMTEVQKSLELKSDYPETYLGLGFLLELQGKAEEGIAQYRKALDLEPRFYAAYNNIGAALVRMGKLPQAVEQFQKALALYPRYDKALVNLGDALNRSGQPQQAIALFSKAVDIDPANGDAHHNWGVSLLMLRRPREAVAQFRKAIEINPRDAYAHNNLAAALSDVGEFKEAVEHYRKAIELDPAYVPTYNSLAWILATQPDAAVRSGAEAVRLARIACEKTASPDAGFLTTLAAAYAETGNFPEAQRIAKQALDLARSQGKDEQAAQVERYLELFRKGQPIRVAR